MDTMSLILIVCLIAITAGSLAAMIMLNLRLKKMQDKNNSSDAFSLLNQNMQAIQQRIDMTNNAIGERLDNAARVIGAVNRELGSMQQVGLQLKDFQNFLRSPKLRGNLGEQGLKDLLGQILPRELYVSQYKFKSGHTVDIAIKIDAGIIPVDAKSPLENFNRYLSTENEAEKTSYLREFGRDIKKHIDDIAKKYLLHEEGTLDFAFMYLPSESVFFEMINNPQLNEIYQHAIRHKIVLTSPSTFFYYLRTIMLGLEGRKVNEMSQQILKALKGMRQESGKIGDNLSVLSRHIVNAKNMMDTVSINYGQLANKIEQAGNIKSLDETDTKALPEV